MKIRQLFPIVGVAVITAMLASCSSSNQFASSFGKRKYMKGYYFNGGNSEKAVASTKSKAPLSNKTQVTSAPSVTIAAAPKNNGTANVPVVTGYNKLTSVKNNKTVASSKELNKEVKGFVAANSQKAGAPMHSSVEKVSSLENTSNTTYGGSCKSWVTTLVLVILLGDIGIHRFYLGYTGLGVLELLTLGCCGILTLIDFIRICMKTLKPKNGSYCN